MRQTDQSSQRAAVDGVSDRNWNTAHHSRPRRPWDFWSIGLGMICLVLGLQAFLVDAQDKAAVAPSSTDLHTEKLVRLTFVEKRDLTFDRAGVLEFVQEDGVSVEAGQVVARFLNSREKAALAVALAKAMNNAEVLEAQKQAELAKLKETSAQKAIDDQKGRGVKNEAYNIATMSEFKLSAEAALAAVGRAEKEHSVNEKGIEQAQADLLMTEIKAPVAGQVTRVYKRSGEGVQAGEKVLQLISTQRIRASVEVPVTLLSRMKVGMPVTVIVDHANDAGVIQPHRYPTTLKWIDPSVIPGGQKVTIWTELDNSNGKLREGLTTSLELAFDKPGATAPAAVK